MNNTYGIREQLTAEEFPHTSEELELNYQDDEERGGCCKRKLENQGHQPNKKAKHIDPHEFDPTGDDEHEETSCSLDESCDSNVPCIQDYYPVTGELLKNELGHIAEALLWSDLFKTSRLITEFNQKYHLQGAKMEVCDECGHIVLVERLLRKLKLVNTCEEAREFKSESCFLLGLLSRNEHARNVIMGAGGMEFILSHLKQACDCITAIRYCCYAIGNMVTSLSDDTGDFHRYITDEGLIPFVFDILQKNLNHWQLAQQVFFAIGNISFVSDFEQQLLECNAVGIALECVSRHTQHVPMCTDAIFFLKNMAYGETGREEILANGGVKIALNALWKNQKHSELVELSLNLFFDLSFSGATEELTKDLGPIKFFISLLKQHKASLPPVKECVRTLSRLYANSNESVRLAMIQEGLVEAFISAFSHHSDNKNLRRQMESTFSRISREKAPPFTSLPPKEEKVPSLLELVARSIADKKIPYSENDLPEDLATLLSSRNCCLICSRTYLRHQCSAVCPVNLPPFLCSAPVPMYLSFCSETCFHKVKDQSLELFLNVPPTSASAVTPITTPVTAHAMSMTNDNLSFIVLNNKKIGERDVQMHDPKHALEHVNVCL